MRCGVCSAFNPDAAAWCNQCFHDLRAGQSNSAGRSGEPAGPVPPPGPISNASTGAGAPVRRAGPGDGERPVTDGDVDTVQDETPVPLAAGVTDTSRDSERDPEPDDGVVGADARADIRATHGQLAWRCPTCAHWSPLEARACASCGTPFRIPTDTQEAAGAAEREDDARERAVWLNAVLPGLGHLLAGWTGSGLARMILFSVWIVGGLLLLGAGGSLVAVPLLLGAAALWLTGVVDGRQLRSRGRQILSGRALLWLVIGVTALAVLAVGAAAVSGLARA